MLLFMLRMGFNHTEPWSNIRLYWSLHVCWVFQWLRLLLCAASPALAAV
jgi:hypothetical protein